MVVLIPNLGYQKYETDYHKFKKNINAKHN